MTTTTRIKELENKVISDSPDPKETFLSIHNDAENALHEKAREIQQSLIARSDVTLEELNDVSIPLSKRCDMAKEAEAKMNINSQDLEILNRSHDLVDRRIFDLFVDNETAKYQDQKVEFIERLFWFLNEFHEYVNQQNHALIIEESPEYETTDKDLVDEYFKTQRALWTLESWDNFFKEYIMPIIRKHLLEEDEKLKQEPEQKPTVKHDPITFEDALLGYKTKEELTEEKVIIIPEEPTVLTPTIQATPLIEEKPVIIPEIKAAPTPKVEPEPLTVEQKVMQGLPLTREEEEELVRKAVSVRPNQVKKPRRYEFGNQPWRFG